MNKLIAIVLITLSTTIFAQDKTAKNIIDKLNSTTKSYKNISIEFDLILENKSQNIEERQQIALVISGNTFQLNMDNQTIINNGENQWIHLADMNEVQIMDNDEEYNISLDRLLSDYEDKYKYTYAGAKIENGKTLQMIDLLPKKSLEFIKITIIIDTNINQLYAITTYDKNGGTCKYVVKSFKSNTTIKPFIFNIKDFPGAELIDLR